MDNLEFFSFIHPVLIYGVIFLGLALEGEIVLIAAGLLVYFGLVNYFLVLITVFLGAWLGDMVWYWAGKTFGSRYFEKHQRWLFLTKKRWLMLQKHFVFGNSQRTIFFSKFSYGINHAIIVVAGASGMSRRKFIKVDAYATLAWAIIILGLVQFLGQSFDYIQRLTKNVGLAVAVVVIIFVLVEIVVGKKAVKKL
ncbi:MAG: DedA family protein [Candidatus Komeilibacteria bacterium]|nr:DedA family protein [Candidatus Komeilibacteria bacterium]